MQPLRVSFENSFPRFLAFKKPLSTALQGPDMDFVNGYTSVNTLTDLTKRMSLQEFFEMQMQWLRKWERKLRSLG